MRMTIDGRAAEPTTCTSAAIEAAVIAAVAVDVCSAVADAAIISASANSANR